MIQHETLPVNALQVTTCQTSSTSVETRPPLSSMSSTAGTRLIFGVKQPDVQVSVPR